MMLLAVELIYFYFANIFNIIDKPNQRSSHKHITLRGGGIIFLIGAWVWTAFCGLQYPWFMVGLTIIAGVSFIDDVLSLPDSMRLGFHFLAMFLMFYDLDILNWQSWWIVIVSLIVCVGIINAYNFMDGINGITGGYSLAVLVPLLYLDTPHSVGKSAGFIDFDLLIIIGLSAFVFCFFNFRKRAKCFAGDVGAVAMAFILVFAIGRLILQTGDFTYIMLLAIYGLDTVLTICHRILQHEHLGEAHRKHAYQLMANELGLPHVAVSSIYMALQLVVSFGLILLPINHWLYLAAVLVALCAVYLLFIKKYYHLHEVYLASLEK